MTRCIVAACICGAITGCASQQATVSAAGETSAPPVAASQPAGLPLGADSDATAQSGFANIVSDIRAALEAYAALVQTNQQAGRDIVTENHGDVWLNRILAMSWLVYPFVWRPIRNWRGRRET